MILTSTDAVHPYTPPWYFEIAAGAADRFDRTVARLREQFEKDSNREALDAGSAQAERDRAMAEAQPVFKLRAAGVIERGDMEAQLSGKYRAHLVQGFELKEAMRNGVATLISEDDPEREDLLALIARQGLDDANFDEEETRKLVEVQKALAEHWPEYGSLIEQMERRRQIAPIVALRRYCVGWTNCRDKDGDEVPFARGPDGLVTEAALSAIQPLDMLAAGNEAYSLQYAQGQAGKSPRPSQSDAGPATSNSGVASKAAGKSAKPSGKKIRG